MLPNCTKASMRNGVKTRGKMDSKEGARGGFPINLVGPWNDEKGVKKKETGTQKGWQKKSVIPC